MSSSRRVKKGLGCRPQSAKRQRFTELRARGWSISPAGRELGVSRSSANDWVRGYKTYRRGEAVSFVRVSRQGVRGSDFRHQPARHVTAQFIIVDPRLGGCIQGRHQCLPIVVPRQVRASFQGACSIFCMADGGHLVRRLQPSRLANGERSPGASGCAFGACDDPACPHSRVHTAESISSVDSHSPNLAGVSRGSRSRREGGAVGVRHTVSRAGSRPTCRWAAGHRARLVRRTRGRRGPRRPRSTGYRDRTTGREPWPSIP